MIIVYKAAVTSIIFTLLAGCGGKGHYTDLQKFMDEQRAKPKGMIEPLPKFTTYAAFTYSAAGLRSPFTPPIKKLDTGGPPKSDVRPDENRPKQFLEGFGLETFEMVGSLSNKEEFYGLVRGGGGVHRIKVGEYIGKNHGRVLSIDDGEIKLIEIVPNGRDSWIERPRSITLKE